MLLSEEAEETGFSFAATVPSPPERRGHERFLRILRVGALIVDGRRELCLIRNISAGGLMAHVYSRLRPEQCVGVELRAAEAVTGRVAWVRNADCGIAFDTPIDVAELLAGPALDNGWRVRSPRIETDRLATLRAGARTYWVQARDISLGGARVEGDQPLAPGSVVVLTLEGFRPIAGAVRWQSGGECGIAFNEPLAFAELISWLRAAG